MVFVTSTRGRPGSFTRFVSNIGASFKATFTPKSEKTTIITTSSGQKVLAPASSPKPSSSGGGISVSSSGSSGGRTSGGGGSSGGGTTPTILATTSPTPQPKQVGVAPSSTEQALSIGTRIPTPSDKFGFDFFRTKVAAPFFFAGNQGGTPLTSIRNVGSLFTDTSKKTGDLPFFEPQFGTISTEQPTGFKQTSGFEESRRQALEDPSLLIPPEVKAQRESERISRELVSEIQPRISSGEISVSEGEELFGIGFGQRVEEITPEFERDIKRTSRFQRNIESGEQPQLDVGTIAELGGIVALSPSPVGQAIIGGSFVSDSIPNLGKSILGEDISIGERLKFGGVGTLQAGFGLGVGGLAGRTAERIADRSLIQELQSQRGILTGGEVARDEFGSVFDTNVLRQFGSEARSETRLISPVFSTGEDTFSITGGRGRSVLDVFSTEKGKKIKLIEDFSFGGRGTTSDLPIDIVKGKTRLGFEDFTGSFGEGFVQKKGKDTFIEFPFGGVSRDIESGLGFGKITEVKSGRRTGVRLGGIFELPKGGKLFKDVRGKFPIEESGFIRPLTITEGEGVKFLQPSGKGKRTPLSVTFQEQKVKAPPGISTAIERQIFKPSQIIKPPTQGRQSLIGLQTAVGGEGLTEQQIKVSRKDPIFSRSSFDLGSGKMNILNLGMVGTLSRGRFKTSLKQPSIAKQFQPQFQPQAQFQPLKFKEELKQVQELAKPMFTPPTFRGRGVGFEGLGRGGFIFPPFKLPTMGEKPKGKRPKSKRKLFRIPSFAAVELGLTAPKISKAEITGLVERRIIKKRKVKKISKPNKIIRRKKKKSPFDFGF